MFELYVGKDGFLEAIRVVSANPDAYINGIFHDDRYRGSRHKRLTRLSGEGCKLIALTLNSEPGRAVLGGKCVVCLAAIGGPELKIDVAVAMNCCIGVS